MSKSRTYRWVFLPLIATGVVSGCATADEANEPADRARDSAEHTHHHHARLPEVAWEDTSLDAGTRTRAPIDVADEAEEDEHVAYADDHHAAHASDAAVVIEAARTDAAKPASDARVPPPRSGEVEGAASTFDAGAGQLQPDGKTVVYRIPNGTGNKDWNSRDNPINIERGMTLKLIDDDKTAKGGGHWLHSFGICPHSSRAIGSGYECKIPQTAKTGLQSGLFEHNIANAGGRIYLVVVD